MSQEIANTLSESSSIARMLLEPRQIRKITDANCESFDKLKEKVDSCIEPAYIYSNGMFVCNSKYDRVLNHYGCPKGLLGAKQLENIIKVLDRVEIDNSKSLESVDLGWLMKAIDEIRYVSDDVLSIAWSKLITNEIENGDKYSKKTISLLAELSRDDALLFEKYAKKILLSNKGEGFLFSFNPVGQQLMEIKKLDYAGFIDSEGLLFKTSQQYIWNDYCLVSDSLKGYALTQFGIDVFGILDINMKLEDYAEELKVLTENKIKWSLHKMTCKDRFTTIPILKSE